MVAASDRKKAAKYAILCGNGGNAQNPCRLLCKSQAPIDWALDLSGYKKKAKQRPHGLELGCLKADTNNGQ